MTGVDELAAEATQGAPSEAPVKAYYAELHHKKAARRKRERDALFQTLGLQAPDLAPSQAPAPAPVNVYLSSQAF